MKQIIYISLLLIAIPFFIVIISSFEGEIPKDEQKELEVEEKVYVRLKREKTGNIEKIELEEYVLGVLAGEMPVSFHIEALKAQAVASRSYVLKRLKYNKENDYDVVDSVTNQVYLDNSYLEEKWLDKYNENIAKLKKAVTETKLECIFYEGEIADALFFSTSNGFTENSEEIFNNTVPYLRSVESVWDEKTSPVFNDQKTYNKNDFYNMLGIKKSKKLETRITEYSDSGRIVKIKINGIEMKGSDVRTKLGLRSTDFQIQEEGEKIIIKTSGFGHGVGMSQYGALGMANEGYKYDEILKYYYQGISINKYKNK
ncbi:MAG TPA: stage II sporulation protein D [Mollicutes bacterium]|nr:stage II sporulation protein D [Mollicutes bacterium]